MNPKIRSNAYLVHGLLEALGHALALPYHWLATRLLLAVSPRSQVAGFEVIRIENQAEQVVCDRLAEALDLIQCVDAKRLRRIRRDIRRILVVGAGGPEYWPLADGFILDYSYIAEAPIERIALTIAHEATHARLWNAGVRYRGILRGRIEELCVRSEIALAARLPASEKLIHQAQEKLADPWWNERRIFERRLAAMRKVGWPEWFLRPYGALFRPNRRQ